MQIVAPITSEVNAGFLRDELAQTRAEMAQAMDGLCERAALVDYDLMAAMADPACRFCHGSGVVPVYDGVESDVPGASVRWATDDIRPCVCVSEIPYDGR